ncbi:MAG TPA: hypothetical protein VG318_08880 [Actinomycetota bacterium]|nr:hypothetical protein [Actinomycetota bacterium]
MADTWKRLKDEKTYPATPELACDVVMKGGITSGIAYPLAVCEIAAKYRLVNVGGSSAGAIAAAAAAAAEVGRTTPSGGFARLASFPERLAGAPGAKHSMLFELFQPQPAMHPYYRLLMAFVESGLSNGQRVRRAVWRAFRSFWPGGVLGALPGALAFAFLVVLDVRVGAAREDPWAVLGIFLGLLAALALAVAGGVAGLAFRAARAGMASFARNMFGICSGYVPAGTGEGAGCTEDQQRDETGKCQTKPLTTWLADEIDCLAGRTPGAGTPPLTLGDLCDRDVQLRMFTTNLANGKPYTIPFKEVLYFDEEELRKLFPPRVVDWMVAHGQDVSDETNELLRRTSRSLHPLPRWDDFPVIVATRMSLSFPLLLTAVPLWQIDWVEGKPYRAWFSDGGITSNFPVHFFDSPIPRRPTFGLNLGPFRPGEEPSADECLNIYSPKSNDAGLWPRWSEVDSVGRFGRAILDTMQNWSDNAQTLLPGYRDRIVLIKHTEDEGGMNLDMPRERILGFAERGRCAGATLVAKFSTQQPADPKDKLSWDNHRWIRYRSTMSTLETFVEGWLRGYRCDPAPSGRTFAQLIDDPVSYKWSGAQKARGAELTEALAALAKEWLDAPEDGPLPDAGCVRPPAVEEPKDPYDPRRPFRKGAPRPRTRLRITPDF